MVHLGWPTSIHTLNVAANRELRGKEMVNVLIGFGLLLIILIAAAFLVYYFFPAAFPVFSRRAHVPNQGVIKTGLGCYWANRFRNLNYESYKQPRRLRSTR